MRALRLSGILLAAFALLFVGCGEDSGGDENPGVDAGAGGEGGGGETSASALSIAAPDDAFVVVLGGDLQLTLNVTLTDGTADVATGRATWSSDDEGVATVEAGAVRAVAAGTTTISAAFGGLDTTVEVTVEDLSIDSIKVRGSLALNDSFGLTALAKMNDGSEMDVTDSAEWATTNERIVALDGPGTGAIGATGGPVQVTASVDGVVGTLDTTVECVYPRYADLVRFGGRLPPVNWAEARNKEGEVVGFSAQDFMCFDQYRDKSTLFVLINAGWCAPCHARIRQIARLWDRIEENGGEVLLITAETADFAPAGSEYASDHVTRLIGNRYGIRVGDLETRVEDEAIPNFFLETGFVRYFPTVFAVRKRDMVVIAEQGESRYTLPYPAIAADPEQDWQNPGPPVTISECGANGEEASEPGNNFARTAQRVGAGSYEGGICDSEPDYYYIDIEGAWRAELVFEHATGDLDMYGWDVAQGQVLVNNGNLVGSDTEQSPEVFEYRGKTTIMVTGFFGQSAPYTLNITAL